MIRLFRRSVPLILVLGAFSGCAIPSRTVDLPPQTMYSLQKFRKEYVIGPGDSIEILVQRAPEVSRTVLVRPDGVITLPTLGDVPAAGKSFPELHDDLVQRLSERLNQPEVDIIALDLPPAVVYVVGEVAAPRAVPLRTARTAAAALAQTGGFRVSARRCAVLIRLQDDGRLAAIPLVADKSGTAEAYLSLDATILRADDILVVPEGARSQFTRFIDDFINKPLNGINSMLGTYVNYRLAEELDATTKQIKNQ